jgi:mxaJ protein
MRTDRALVISCILLAAAGSLSCRQNIQRTAIATQKLRVCADPNNLPFSNREEQGFENKIAQVVARELQREVEYTWWAQRRGFIRNTLAAGDCDLIAGITTGMDGLQTTTAYYRSTYMFVSQHARGFDIRSLDSPLLRKVRLGVQIIGDDYANTPPAHALARRGIVNVRGYRLLDDYSQPNPPARIVEAVAKGEVDIALVWGPLAGYFAALQETPLDLVPVSPSADGPFLPFVYDISMGVRRGETEFKERIESALTRSRDEINRILGAFHVPRLDDKGRLI